MAELIWRSMAATSVLLSKMSSVKSISDNEPEGNL